MDCIFCKIANKEIPVDFLGENETAFAMLDIRPHAPGHTMVIPKRHSATILDLPSEDVAPLFGLVKQLTDRILKALQPQGFTIGINHGEIAGQSIPHLHIHILPRFEGDGGGSIHSVVKNSPQESLEEIAAKIKAIR